jgi:hypothetical protein
LIPDGFIEILFDFFPFLATLCRGVDSASNRSECLCISWEVNAAGA